MRARTDCFNRQIWLDESASEVGHRRGFLQLPRWLAGSLMGRGGEFPRSFLWAGASLQESAFRRDLPRMRVLGRPKRDREPSGQLCLAVVENLGKCGAFLSYHLHGNGTPRVRCLAAAHKQQRSGRPRRLEHFIKRPTSGRQKEGAIIKVLSNPVQSLSSSQLLPVAS